MDGGPSLSARPTPAPSRVGLVPREHGASLMALHALALGTVAGLTAGYRTWQGFALVAALGLLFPPLAAAVSAWTHPRLAAAARRRALALGTGLGLVCVLALAYGPRRELLGVGAAAAAAVGAYSRSRSARRRSVGSATWRPRPPPRSRSSPGWVSASRASSDPSHDGPEEMGGPPTPPEPPVRSR